jgi:hypothetical protein
MARERERFEGGMRNEAEIHSHSSFETYHEAFEGAEETTRRKETKIDYKICCYLYVNEVEV